MIRAVAARTSAATLLLPIVAVVLALATTALLLLLAGADPLRALSDMWTSSFGSTFALGTTIVKALPRLFTGLAVALALRAGLWNIGAEGQLYVGAVAATGVALYVTGLPETIAPGVILLAAAAAGAAWAWLPGVLKAHRGISEVITSLMLVYIGIQLASYVATGPWSTPGATFPASNPVPSSARLPILGTGTSVHAGLIVAILVALLVWVLLDRTSFGVRLRAVGGNVRAANALGLSAPRLMILAMCLSGALAGIAGGVEVLGSRGRLIEGFSPGYGFEGIAVALLGRLRVGGIVAAALLFGALDAGGAGLQASGTGLSAAVVQVTGALAVTYLLAALGLSEIVTRRSKAKAALANADHTAAREQPSHGTDVATPTASTDVGQKGTKT